MTYSKFRHSRPREEVPNKKKLYLVINTFNSKSSHRTANLRRRGRLDTLGTRFKGHAGSGGNKRAFKVESAEDTPQAAHGLLPCYRSSATSAAEVRSFDGMSPETLIFS